MAESWARRLSLCLACKPFPGLCRVPELAGGAREWWQLGLCLCMFTNRADRRSQTNRCATRVSKTLYVVHRYALLVSNSNML